MVLKHMYVDESGDLGLRGSKYLILTALLVDDPRHLDRLVKNMRRNKFRKQLKKACEIKANKSSDEIRKHVLEKLNEVNGARIFYVVLEKKKVFSEFLKNDKNKLYNYVAGKLARHITLGEADIDIKVDESKGKHLLREDFNMYFLRNLKENSNTGKITIEHSYSHSWSGLQFADVLAWACFQKFEHSNSEYVDLVNLEQEVCHVW